MNQHFKPKPTTEAERREAHRQAVHSLALEGAVLDEESERLSQEVVAGRMTEEQYRAAILSRS